MQSLSHRELSCLQWVSIGKTSWEIGLILGLAERTINFHIQNACRKLGVNGRMAAITIALRAGMLELDEHAVSALPPVPRRPLGRSRRQSVIHPAGKANRAIRPRGLESWPRARLGNDHRTLG